MRRGFLLPMVLVVVGIVFLLAFTRHFFSRQHLHMVQHLADHEKAYHLALSGVRAGVEEMNEALRFFNSGDPQTFPKRDKAPAGVREILEALLAKDDTPDAERGAVPVRIPILEEFARGMAEGATLQVGLELKRGKPLFVDAGEDGIVPDLQEAEYYLLVHGDATVGAASCRVSWYRPAKFVNILPPVLGKFVLFLREQGFLKVNSLKDALDTDRLDDSPVIVTGGRTLGADLLEPGALTAMLDGQGWVFLGGPFPWRLNLSNYAGSERFQDALLQARMFLHPVPAAEPFAANRNVRYYSFPELLFEELKSASQEEALSQRPEPLDSTSIIHAAGAADSPAPTLVLGNVSRSWALIQGLFNEANQKRLLFPCLDRQTFLSDFWPGRLSRDEARRIRDNFGGSWEAYAARMSDLIEEDYNAANLTAVRFSSPEGEGFLFPAEATPNHGLVLPPPSRRLETAGMALPVYRRAFPNAVTIKDDQGRPLFRNGSLDLFPDPAWLKRKAGPVFPDGETLWKGLPRETDGRYFLGGIVLVQSGLEIDRPVGFVGGGMLLVQGGITLKARVDSPSFDPVSLVSLGGDVRVETGDPIAAGLIALSGKLILGKTSAITGLAAARELSPSVAKPFSPRSITYNSAFDPTDRANYRRGYRLMAWGRGVTFVR